MINTWKEIRTGGNCTALSWVPPWGGEVLLTDGAHHAPREGLPVHVHVIDCYGEETDTTVVASIREAEAWLAARSSE